MKDKYIVFLRFFAIKKRKAVNEHYFALSLQVTQQLEVLEF